MAIAFLAAAAMFRVVVGCTHIIVSPGAAEIHGTILGDNDDSAARHGLV